MSESTRTVIDEIQRVPAHLTSLLEMLVKWVSRLSNELDLVPEGASPPRDLAKQMGEIAKTSKPIAQELRAWVGKVTEVQKSLSLGDKLKVSLNLIQELSMGDRLRFYQLVNETERARSDGGIRLVVTRDG